MTIEMCVYECVGISPLLQNNPASMKRAATDGPVRKKAIPTPEDEAASKVYKLKNGQIYIPANAFRSALLRGAIGKRIGKVAATTQFGAGVFNAEIECPLYHPKTKKPIKTYIINVMRAVVMGMGVMRARPEIKEWACKVVFEVDDDFVTAKQTEEILNLAGRIAGVGDYRPQKKGPYGRFTARLLKAA